jgi:RNA polymerase sigma-70 factor (ECF subfamily)
MTEVAFLSAIENHKGILVKVSRTYCDTPEDQQDLVQEIIFQLWKSKASFKGESKFSSWMYRVALNTAIVFFKKEKRKPDRYKGLKDDQISDETYQSDKDDQLQLFYRAVRQLDKIEKSIILQYIEGFSGQEIANNLGLSPANVRVKTNRTKKKLLEIIKRQEHEL